MSFGKAYSPEKYWVDSAVAYAEQNDVLLVHSAGNENYNLDSITVFPNANLAAYKKNASSFITVGASSDTLITEANIAADFSNYGKQTVDLFAPGVKIYSTLPGGNTYGNQDGTSMAAPIVTGVAAVCGKSTVTPVVIIGAATMKIISKTNITSTSGVTFISEMGSFSVNLWPAMVYCPPRSIFSRISSMNISMRLA
jgi:subtilisin family serine protease